jgi:hypothetical protein
MKEIVGAMTPDCSLPNFSMTRNVLWKAVETSKESETADYGRHTPKKDVSCIPIDL